MIASLVSFTIRYLFFYYGIDILDVATNPWSSICAFFSINSIRYFLANILETIFKDYYIPIDGSNIKSSNSNSNSNIHVVYQDNPNAQNSQTTQSGGNSQSAGNHPSTANPSYIGVGFRIVNGVYIIDDPTMVGGRGYINPITGMPYNQSFQPFARNLANAMAYRARDGIDQFHTGGYSQGVDTFLLDFMRYNHPERSYNAYWNSNPVRNEIRRLP